MAEFEEIVHTGGSISALVQGTSVALEIKHSEPNAATLVPICVSFEDGKIYGYPRVLGMGGGRSDCPQHCFEIYLLSDREGMFGQKCRACEGYFRNVTAQSHYCPYCAVEAPGPAFLTKAQLQFLTNVMNMMIEAVNEGASRTVNLSALIANPDENRPGWVYSEERQQSQHTCSACRVRYDILGEYAVCPACGTPNFRSIYTAKMDALFAEFQTANAAISERHEREVEWTKLTVCVSEFDALVNKAKMLLLQLPATPNRSKAVAELNGLNIIGLSEKLALWFDIDPLGGRPNDDKQFLNKMFNRRHLAIHKGGQVDQEYLDNTGDQTVRLHQRIRFRSNEIARLIPLVKDCGLRILDGLDALFH